MYAIYKTDIVKFKCLFCYIFSSRETQTLLQFVSIQFYKKNCCLLYNIFLYVYLYRWSISSYTYKLEDTKIIIFSFKKVQQLRYYDCYIKWFVETFWHHNYNLIFFFSSFIPTVWYISFPLKKYIINFLQIGRMYFFLFWSNWIYIQLNELKWKKNCVLSTVIISWRRTFSQFWQWANFLL